MKKFYVLCIIIITGGLKAQSNVVAAGGNAIGADGSSSYTIGQIDYRISANPSYHVNEGIQQPYEIEPLAVANPENIIPVMSVYPNPVTNILNLDIEKVDGDLHYDLYDVSGKVIRTGVKISGTTTPVSMEGMRTGIYFLSISNGNEVLRGFKIVKN